MIFFRTNALSKRGFWEAMHTISRFTFHVGVTRPLSELRINCRKTFPARYIGIMGWVKHREPHV